MVLTRQIYMLTDHKPDHIWNAQSVVNIREFTNNIKEYEHYRFIEKWKQYVLKTP